MVNSRELHEQYNNLYTAFRNYIWDYETVMCLANLEVATYQLCPNLDDISKYLSDLDYRISLTDISDPEIDGCIDNMYATLNDDASGVVYCKLPYVEEEVSKGGYDED